MLRTFLFGFAWLCSSATLAAPVSCGGAQIEISFDKSTHQAKAVEAILIASRNARSTILRYDGSIDFIGAECRKTKGGRTLVLFQAYCGGSGCKDLSNFGVIDPVDLRVLAVPTDTSHLQVNRLFGAEVAPISGDNMQSVAKAYDKLFGK